MDQENRTRSTDPAAGGFTLLCRLLCSALVVSPLVYFLLVTDGDAYLFLVMVLLAPIAGVVLIANSLYCLFAYRGRESPWISVVFLLLGASGFWTAWHFLPMFRMH